MFFMNARNFLTGRFFKRAPTGVRSRSSRSRGHRTDRTDVHPDSAAGQLTVRADGLSMHYRSDCAVARPRLAHRRRGAVEGAAALEGVHDPLAGTPRAEIWVVDNVPLLAPRPARAADVAG
ncbi:MAG: hypothetical protein U1F11_05830 [Steroidobacteraceae bacterium]